MTLAIKCERPHLMFLHVYDMTQKKRNTALTSWSRGSLTLGAVSTKPLT